MASADLAFFNNYYTQQALAEVGLPNPNDPNWGYKFFTTLSEKIEAQSPLLKTANEMTRLASEWLTAMNRIEHQPTRGNHNLDNKPLFEMIKLQPIEIVARYLSVSVDQLHSWLWPRTDIKALSRALTAMKGGMTITRAYKQFGVHWDILGPAAAAHRIERAPVTADGRKVMTATTKEKILAMQAEGFGPKACWERLAAEGVTVEYATVKRTMQRARV